MKLMILLDRDGTDVPVQLHPKFGIVGCGAVNQLYRKEFEVIQALMATLQPFVDNFQLPTREPTKEVPEYG